MHYIRVTVQLFDEHVLDTRHCTYHTASDSETLHIDPRYGVRIGRFDNHRHADYRIGAVQLLRQA